MTSRLVTLPTLLLVVHLFLGATTQSHAAELRLTTANDPISGGAGDDLYTAALGFELRTAIGELRLGERMFTDREAGTRFDETFVELGRALPSWRGWSAHAGLGALRVGEGLAGQQVQNEIHHAIGSDRLQLAYPAETRWFPTATANLERALGNAAKDRLLSVAAEAASAPGFRHHLRVGVRVDRALGASFALRAGVGVRTDAVETRLLADHVRDAGLTAELALRYRRLELRYGYNDFGTATGHLSLAVRVGDALAAGPRRR